MKIVFRVNYHTVPGQSLWLHLALISPDGRTEQQLPLHWRDHQHWETRLEIDDDITRVEYSYQFQQSGNGIQLDEWAAPRVIDLDGGRPHLFLAADTWCSAGTVDHALDTDAFPSPPRALSDPPASAGNHEFQLRMTAVPDGHLPCLLGGVPELGAWDLEKPLLLSETAPNLWRASVQLASWDRIEYKYGLYDLAAQRVRELELWENRVLEGHLLASHQFTRVSDEGYRRHPSSLPRGAGVAIPVFSLRNAESLGIGEFADLKPLAGWAADCGLKLIQILPVNDTTSSHRWTDSYPYSAISVFALHPIYLRLQSLDYDLPEDLSDLRLRLNALPEIDYEAVSAAKLRVTRAIYEENRSSILADPCFQAFVDTNREWLIPYAVFCVKRDQTGTADFSRWENGSVFSWDFANAFAAAHSAETGFHLWLQYELARQLSDVVAHLHARGIILKGDLPIGINRESADAWSAPHLFHMDVQAGAPPDAFAAKGQNWGFPTYNWEAMKQDGYAWWRKRFSLLSRYFDAYRIDHILGFFRIWQIPADQIDGIMGWFDPAIPIHLCEFGERGIDFDKERFCQPWLPDALLEDRFGDDAVEARKTFLERHPHTGWKLREPFATQRQIAAHFSALPPDDPTHRLKESLMDCVSEVLFFEVPGSGGELFHPRCAMQATRSWQDLDDTTRQRIDDLYIDYFYRRQEDFWQAQGLEKLPAMRAASRMLLCGEDLGMVPACVPGVLRDLGILSLEIQRMPKTPGEPFSDPARAPYLSVVSPSTHDMPTLRGWWREDPQLTAHFAWNHLGLDFPPLELSGELAARILAEHLHSPAMWVVFPLQDLLAIDETLRHPDPDQERINIPAITPFYWRYRMHLTLDQLTAAAGLNEKLRHLVAAAGR